MKIDLEPDENEQAIFDSVNSYGVRLTCADTIKNALFQKVMEFAGSDEDSQAEVVNLYKDYWEKTFIGDSSITKYWSTEQRMGRISRDNLELLLHCIALIKGFFDPEKHNMSDLADVYKSYVNGLNKAELHAFVKEIADYGLIYKKYFAVSDSITSFEYCNDVQRLFHILAVCDVSTLHSYILMLLKTHPADEDGKLLQELIDELKVTVDTETPIEDEETAKEIRRAAIYEIGNMTILNRKLNSSLSNKPMKEKLDGKGRTKGMRVYSSLDVAQEVIKTFDDNARWNEKIIRDRTNKLYAKFLKLWPAEFASMEIDEDMLLYLDSNDIKATGYYLRDNRFRVNKDSYFAQTEVPSCRPNVKQKRKELIDNGIVKDGVFISDYLFGSPSTAASCILGGDKNGKILWKNDSGVTLKNMYPDRDDNPDDGQLSLEDIVSAQ